MQIGRVAVASIAVLTLAGCASSGPKRPEWTKPGSTLAELNQDKYECEQKHTYPSYKPGSFIVGGGYRPRLDEDLFRSCMRVKRWVHEDD